MADVLSSKFYSNHTLHFTKNDVVGDSTGKIMQIKKSNWFSDSLVISPSSFVVIDDLRFLVNLRCKILLTQTLRLSALLDDTSDAVVNALVLQLFSLSVQFRSISGRSMLLIRPSINCNEEEMSSRLSQS